MFRFSPLVMMAATWLASALAATSAEVQPSATVGAYEVVRLIPAAGAIERIFVMPDGAPKPRKFSVIAGADGSQLLFAEPGDYNVLWFREGTPEQGQFVVTILPPGPSPVPPNPIPPGPTPPNPGPNPPAPVPVDPVAARLVVKFRALNDPASAAKVLAAVQQYRAELPTIKAIQVASVRWREIMATVELPQAWKPGIEAIIAEMNTAKSMQALPPVIDSVIAALEAI